MVLAKSKGKNATHFFMIRRHSFKIERASSYRTRKFLTKSNKCSHHNSILNCTQLRNLNTICTCLRRLKQRSSLLTARPISSHWFFASHHQGPYIFFLTVLSFNFLSVINFTIKRSTDAYGDNRKDGCYIFYYFIFEHPNCDKCSGEAARFYA